MLVMCIRVIQVLDGLIYRTILQDIYILMQEGRLCRKQLVIPIMFGITLLEFGLVPQLVYMLMVY